MNHLVQTISGQWAIRYNLQDHGWYAVHYSTGEKTKVFHSQKRLLESLTISSRRQKVFFQAKATR